MSGMTLKLCSVQWIKSVATVTDLSQNVRCRNHVRTIHRVVNSSEVYVCATGAYNPQEFYLNVRPDILPCQTERC